MKNILKYTAAAALVVSLASCQEFEDYTQVVGGASKLVYVNAGTDNLFKARIVHRPTASTGEFSTEFGVSCNTPVHGAADVTLTYDASLVEEYNTKNKTAYSVLPEEYLVLENTNLTLAANALKTEGQMKVALSTEADLSQLTERSYLAPLRLQSSGLGVSDVLGVVYLLVETEKNIIRPISSRDEMVGFPAPRRSLWLADCNAFRNLFDGSTSTACKLDKQIGNKVLIDMGQSNLITGFSIGASAGAVSIEYSLDGVTFEQAGTPVSSDYVTSSSQMYISLEENINAQYIRLSVDFSGGSRNLTEFGIYKLDIEEPVVYAMAGADNVLAGSIMHHTVAGAFGSLSGAFNVYTTHPTTSGYAVAAAFDETLVAAYNQANKTSYKVLPAENLLIEGSPCVIAADAKESVEQIKVSLQGDLSALTDSKGYLAAVKLSAEGAESSESRGVVYVKIATSTSSDTFRKNFTVSDIPGTLVADRSAWTIVDSDASGVHSGSYLELFDGKTATYVRTWGGPISFTVDLGREYDLTGMKFESRSDYGSKYAPVSVSIEYSLDGINYLEMETPTQTAGTILKALPDSYIALYGSQKMRYLKIVADYNGSNMGTAEFNIYEK